jgi:hypothetical protein
VIFENQIQKELQTRRPKFSEKKMQVDGDDLFLRATMAIVLINSKNLLRFATVQKNICLTNHD